MRRKVASMPKQTVLVVCGDTQGVYLATKKRGFGAGYLNGYGGKVTDDETPRQTAQREVQEEGGIRIGVEDLEERGTIDFFEGETLLWTCHLFYLTKWEGDFSETEEMGKATYYPYNQIPYDQMWEGDQAWFPQYLEGNIHHATAHYTEGMQRLNKVIVDEVY